MMADLASVKKETGLMIPEPMKVKVGDRYELMYQGNIISVTLKKIVTDSAHQVVGVIVTKSTDKGLLRHFKEEAITVSVADLKQRLIQGGLKEAVIV